MSKAPVKISTESWPRSQLRPDCGQQKMNLNLQRINVVSKHWSKNEPYPQRIITNNVLSNIGQRITCGIQWSVVNGYNAILLMQKNSLYTWFLNHILLAFLFSTNLTTVSLLTKNSVEWHFVMCQLTKLNKILIACYKNSVEWHFVMHQLTKLKKIFHLMVILIYYFVSLSYTCIILVSSCIIDLW